jgi:choline kinase
MNPYFATTNNAYSLLLARPFLEDEHKTVSSGFLLLDSDILFSRGLIPYLLRCRGENRVAVRVRGHHDREEIRVSVAEANRIVEIGKETPMDLTYGESIGIEVFSASAAARLFEILEERVRQGDGRTEFYERSFQQMIDEGIELTAVDISDHPALEIDTIEDLDAARSMVFEV